ncbi:MAG: TIGR01212 family radical SAM protein [Deltaproteobacteria bacterium]|nr:TIGR01212 family radical SAM protein [Deltaproteobacteria bacterium]
MGESRPQILGGFRYRKLSLALKQRFGERIQKVTLRGGFGCPNRDGRVGRGGCIFCSEKALLPSCGPAFGPIEDQLEAGLQAVRLHTKANKAIAYFQDQTATDAAPSVLHDLYTRAMNHPDIVALSVGTRPDWIPDEVLSLLSKLTSQKPVFIELGLQSANDTFLKWMNRGHSVADFESAVKRCHQAGLEVIAHVILDLPDETADDRAKTAACLNSLAVEGVKVHNLHVLEHTPLAKLHKKGMFQLSSLLEYAEMVAEFIQMLRVEMIIHRLSGEGPAELMLAPDWGRDKKSILSKIDKTLSASDGWQGKHCE